MFLAKVVTDGGWVVLWGLGMVLAETLFGDWFGNLEAVVNFEAIETDCGRTQKTWGVLAKAGMV